MTEEKYRLTIVILISVFIAAFIVLGIRFTNNFRYTQYDYRNERIIFGEIMRHETPAAFDRRTGQRIEIDK